jgi:4-amino-4-deoxy-L-arabinose transferase-like glycosyltransferase
MLAIVPIAAFLLLALLAYRECDNIRRALLIAAVLWGSCTVALTESLSLFNALTFWPLLLGWTLVCCVPFYFLLFAKNRKPLPDVDTGVEWPPILIVPVLFLAALAVALLVVALFAAPNNYDSMTYHMMRVAHWVQNGSVKFYPTHNPRQLHLSPFAEYAILQFQILTGGDRFAIAVQWFAYALCAAGVSRIARQLGATAVGQVAAAVVAATIPMAVLQAANTQNDLVIALWLVTLVSFGLELRENATKTNALLAGASLGLAVLTKGSAYPLAFPFMLWLIVALVRRHRARAAAPLVVAASIALAINLGHYARNQALYHSPLGPGTEQDAQHFKYANDIHTPGAILSNILRNVAIQLPAPTSVQRQPTDRAGGPFNNTIADAVLTLHRWFHIDPDDPRTTWTGTPFSIWGEGWANENFAPNPLHFLLIIAALVTLCFRRLFTRRSAPTGTFNISVTAPDGVPLDRATLLALAACLVAAFLLFCATLKWQQWHVRLHLPLFVLGAALVGVVLERIWNRFVAAAILVALMVASLFPLLNNVSHPWFGKASVFELKREDQYFMWCPELHPHFNQYAQALRQIRCSNVGYVGNVNDPYYPLWALLRLQDENARLENVDVKNITAATNPNPRAPKFQPCRIVTLDLGKTISLTAPPESKPAP